MIYLRRISALLAHGLYWAIIFFPLAITMLILVFWGLLAGLIKYVTVYVKDGSDLTHDCLDYANNYIDAAHDYFISFFLDTIPEKLKEWSK